MGLIFRLLLTQAKVNLDFNNAQTWKHHQKGAVGTTAKTTIERKKLSSMTPLQVLCSFQTWNAKPIPDNLHKSLANVVKALLEDTRVDPNATAAKNALPGIGLFSMLKKHFNLIF